MWIWPATRALCLFLHHRSGLYKCAFINTSSAMCSLPSRWLTEGYRGHQGGDWVLPQENHFRNPCTKEGFNSTGDIEKGENTCLIKAMLTFMLLEKNK